MSHSEKLSKRRGWVDELQKIEKNVSEDREIEKVTTLDLQ